MSTDTEDFSIVVARAGNAYDVTLNYANGPENPQAHACDLPPDYEDLRPAETDGPVRGWRGYCNGADAGDLAYMAPDIPTLRTMGERLFQNLLGERGSGVFQARLASALNSPAGRMRVRIDARGNDPTVFRMPWEALYDPEEGRWLATDIRTPLQRVLRSNKTGRPPAPASPTLRILVAIANPDGDLNADSELHQLAARVEAVNATFADPRLHVLEPLRAASRLSLFRRIRDDGPHVVHYIGHGSFSNGQGFLHLHNDGGPGTDYLAAADFGIQVSNDPPLLVVLNTCQGGTASLVDPFGGTAQALVREGVPAVVAMQFPISDPAAIIFSEAFYRSILNLDPVEIAITRARHAILSGPPAIHPELITPVLYCAAQFDGRLMAILPRDPTRDMGPSLASEPPRTHPDTAKRTATPRTFRSPVALIIPLVVAVVAATIAFITLQSPPSELTRFGPEPTVKEARSASYGPLRSPNKNWHLMRPVDAQPVGSEDAYPLPTPTTSPTTQVPSSRPARTPHPWPVETTSPSVPNFPSNPTYPTNPAYPGGNPESGAAGGPSTEQDFIINVGDRVYFEEGTYAIPPDAYPRLDAQADWLIRNPRIGVRIEGNADDLGSREENLAFAARRAEAVRNYLIERGVAAVRIDTVSYGKERPIAQDASEAAHARNRNARTALTGKWENAESASSGLQSSTILFDALSSVPVPLSGFVLDDLAAALDDEDGREVGLIIQNLRSFPGRGDPDLSRARTASIVDRLEALGLSHDRLFVMDLDRLQPAADETGQTDKVIVEPVILDALRFDFSLVGEPTSDAESHILDTAALWLRAHPGYGLELRASFDRSGASLYNSALAERRRAVVAKALTDRGADQRQIVLPSVIDRQTIEAVAADTAWVDFVIVPGPRPQDSPN